MRIAYIDPTGNRHERDANDGISVMQVAVESGVPGVVGDCGGSCACATCHVYVGSQWQDKLPPMGEFESDMLEVVEDRRANSRLSCQIKMSVALDGLEVEIPSEYF